MDVNDKQNNGDDPLNELKYIGINLTNFQEIKASGKNYSLLGKGSFGYTEKMKSKLNGSIYAIKKIDINNPNFDSNNFFKETEIMIKLQHDNIVKFYGYFLDKENINKYKDIYQENPNIQNENQDKNIACLVMDYAPNGTLENYYKDHMNENKNDFKPIDQKFIIYIFKQVLDALIYLEFERIIHRDIKPDNLLFDEYFNIKIKYFGTSVLCVDKNNNNNNFNPQLLSKGNIIGPIKFVSPEIEKNEKYDYRTDIYSLGLTMLCLMSREYPITIINNPNPNQSPKNININNIDKSYNIYLRKLVLRMINEDQNLRPNAIQAYEELCFIEEYIKNPNNELNKKYVIRLEDIGNKLSDFEEFPNPDKKYTLLGKGNFGYTEKMKSKLNNSVYAIKKLVKTNKNSHEIDFFREIQIMMSLYNENIIRLYGYFEDKENITKYKDIYSNNQDIQKETQDKEIYCLVFEYASNGSLEDFYKKHMNISQFSFLPIDQDYIIKILKQLLNALSYLDNKSIKHRGIKLDNIVLDENDNIKITDIGMSTLVLNENKDTEFFSNLVRIDSPEYILPNEKDQQYDLRFDIFSLGLTMLYLISTLNPISLINNQNEKQNKVFKTINTNYICEFYNSYLIKLIKRMINDDIKLRPSASDAFEEIKYIERLIKKPYDQKARQYLEEINGITNNQNIQLQNQNSQNISKQNSGFQNQNNENIVPQYYNNGNIIDQTTEMSYKNTTIVSSQSPTLVQNPMGNPSILNKSKNTSIIRIFQCLYDVLKKTIISNYRLLVKLNAQNNKNISISLDVLNILAIFIDNFPYQNKNNDDFYNNIQQLRNKISSKDINKENTISRFQGNEEIEPKWVFYGIFKEFNNEFIHKNENNENDIPYNNKIFNGLIEPVCLPRNSFPKIYKAIETFRNKYSNPFVDFFYFILLLLTKCSKCGKIVDAQSNCSYFIYLNGWIQGAKVSHLIENYINSEKSNETQYCNVCNCKVNVQKVYSFLNTPKYLLIDFEGKNKSSKILETEINLTNYAMSNIGPKMYNLYAVITKNDQNQTYVAYIKYNKVWYKFFDENNVQEGLNEEEITNCLIPYMAIYQGIN